MDNDLDQINGSESIEKAPTPAEQIGEIVDIASNNPTAKVHVSNENNNVGDLHLNNNSVSRTDSDIPNQLNLSNKKRGNPLKVSQNNADIIEDIMIEYWRKNISA